MKRQIEDGLTVLIVALVLLGAVVVSSPYVEYPGKATTVQAQALPRGIKAPKPAPVEKVQSIPYTYELPAGEKFVGFRPKDTRYDQSNTFYEPDLFVTEPRPSGEKPRKLTIRHLVGTSAPGTWEVLFYIQEH